MKARLVRTFQRFLLNPLARRLAQRGLAPGYVVLETTGRRSGLPRRVPVGATVEGAVVWIASEHGARSDYVRNIEAEPRVRVCAGGRWLPGRAAVVRGDDPFSHQRGPAARLNALLVRLLGTDVVTVRVELETPPAPGR